MTLLIRSTALEGYAPLAQACGIDVEKALQRVHLAPEILQNQATFISYVAVIRLLEYSASEGQCPDFGLRLAVRQDRSFSGPLTVLMRHADTLGQALEVGSKNLFVLSPTVRFEQVASSDSHQWTDLRVSIQAPARNPHVQSLEQALVFMAQVLRDLSQGQVRPAVALLPHPQLGALASYTAALGCDCQFKAPYAALRIRSKDLEMALPERNPLMLQMAQDYIHQNFGAPRRLVTESVRGSILALLPNEGAPLTQIAKHLGVHSKTLQRRLREEGTQFDELLDDVRRDQFERLIAQNHASNLAQIALMLGYTEQASLTRSCRRWFQCSPSEMRRKSGYR
jgi:AraC-like DNA-binding protein